MRTPFFLPALLSLAACAATQEPYSPVRQVSYSAIGQDPFWSLVIGDGSTVLTRGGGTASEREQLQSFRYPRVLPKTADGVTRWESGEGTAVLTVEARPGPCTGSAGIVYQDRVTVSLRGSQLSGCGGRIIAKGGR
jgi:uncharacterized membrane protein